MWLFGNWTVAKAQKTNLVFSKAHIYKIKTSGNPLWSHETQSIISDLTASKNALVLLEEEYSKKCLDLTVKFGGGKALIWHE